jgi:hypothetical protein
MAVQAPYLSYPIMNGVGMTECNAAQNKNVKGYPHSLPQKEPRPSDQMASQTEFAAPIAHDESFFDA